MRLLDKPLTREQKDDRLDMLKGCIARICVSDDEEEIVRMLGFATDYLSMLAYSRMKQLKQEQRMKVKDLLSVPFEHPKYSKYTIYTEDWKRVPEEEHNKFLDCNIITLNPFGKGNSWISIYCDGSSDLLERSEDNGDK